MNGADGCPVFCIKPSPWHKKHASHRDANSPAIQRVAGIARHQHGIYAEGGCRTEDGTDVCRIADTMKDDNSMRVPTDFLWWKSLWTPHGTKHAARQGVARKLRQEFTTAGIDGHIGRTSFNYTMGIALDMLAFTEQRDWFEACIKRHANHFRAFGNEETLGRLESVAQLSLR